MYHVRSTNGNTKIGGAKFVDRLINYCMGKLKDMMIETEFNNMELTTIRAACEVAKTQLSTQNATDIIISDQKIHITRDDYDRMIEPYIEKTMACVKNALHDGELEKDDINKIILVGGGTYTPLVRNTLESFFGKPVYKDVNPMEAGTLSR